MPGDTACRYGAAAQEMKNERKNRLTRAGDIPLASVIEAAPFALVLTDLDLRIIAASPAATEPAGLTQAQVIGISIFDVTGGAFARFREDFEACLADGSRMPFERL